MRNTIGRQDTWQRQIYIILNSMLPLESVCTNNNNSSNKLAQYFHSESHHEPYSNLCYFCCYYPIIRLKLSPIKVYVENCSFTTNEKKIKWMATKQKETRTVLRVCVCVYLLQIDSKFLCSNRYAYCIIIKSHNVLWCNWQIPLCNSWKFWLDRLNCDRILWFNE